MNPLKIFLTISISLFFYSFSTAQESEKHAVGFGAATFQNTSFIGEWAMEGGGLGGRYFSESFYVGGGGFGMNQSKDDFEYDMGYGGLILGYDWRGETDKTSLNFYVLSGYGGITEKGEGNVDNADGFWVVKPSAEVDFKITHWMRIGVGGGYRWIIGNDIKSLDFNDLSAPYGSFTFRFGNFGS